MKRPDLFAPLPLGFFTHEKVARLRTKDDRAAEAFLVLLAAAEDQTRRGGPAGEIKMQFAEYALRFGIAADECRGRAGFLFAEFAEVGWLEVLDVTQFGFHVRLPNYGEWSANSISSLPKSPANKGSEISLEEKRREEKRSGLVFDYWRERCGHPSARFGSDRRAKINARLREGYSVDDLKRAIDGCAASDFHMGRDSKTQGRRYDELSRICGNSEQVEKFIALGEVGAKRAARGSDFDAAMGM